MRKSVKRLYELVQNTPEFPLYVEEEKIVEQVESDGNLILEKYNLTIETFTNDRELMIKIINEILASDNMLKHLVLKEYVLYIYL